MWSTEELDKKRAYERVYMLKRKQERKRFALEKLGGKCVECGTDSELEFDHIDPSTKVESIGKMWLWGIRRLEDELDKCQLLCRDCHNKKTIIQTGKTIAKGTHGTLSSYRHCKCILCKKAKTDYNINYNLKRKEALAR